MSAREQIYKCNQRFKDDLYQLSVAELETRFNFVNGWPEFSGDE